MYYIQLNMLSMHNQSVSHKEDEIEIKILNMFLASVQVKILKRIIGNQLPKELRSQKMMLRV